MKNNYRVAIVHDQLYTLGGAEKVLKEICGIFPEADVFAVYSTMSEENLTYIMGNRRPNLSFIQRLPQADRLRKLYFPLMPLAVEQFNLNKYDLIISSSYLVAKGIIVGPNQMHVCYIHSPMRYAWDQQWAYLQSISKGPKRTFARLVLHYMRNWDARTANGVDHFLANSKFIARRTEKAYRRKAEVLYPPVKLEPYISMRSTMRQADRLVTMSRLAEGKRIDLLLDSFREMPDLKLDVIGDGDMRARLEAMAPPNVRFLGRLPDAEAALHIAESTGFVYAAEEDFGISPVEAQAAGTPVVALSSGGTAETVVDLRNSTERPTGVLFKHQTPEDIACAVRLLIENRSSFDAEACRQNAARFSEEHFHTGLIQKIQQVMQDQAKAA